MKRKLKKKIKNYKPQSVKSKLRWVSLGVVAIFSGLILKLGYITFVKGSEYKQMAEDQWHSESDVSAKRGNIYDRNRNTIVASANVYKVEFDLDALRQHVEDKGLSMDEIAQKLGDILKMDKNDVMNIINTKTDAGAPASYALLAKGVQKEQVDQIKELKYYGVLINGDVKRYYPNGNFLSHALGSINTEGHGLTGLELEYDQDLSGIAGMNIQGVDRDNNKLPFVPYKYTPAVDGKDLVLTIDENLQYIAEQIAQEGYEKNKAKGVHIVIMNPNNGEVLAMVNKPDYDPNNPYAGYENFQGDNENEKIQSMWRNGLISDTYEPGSTFKNITMIAALQEGVASENDTFVCNGYKEFGSHKVHCWDLNGHGVETLPEILKNSCNVGFMELGARLGKEKLNEYIKKLGFGQTTNIDLPGEAVGIVKPNDEILPIDLGTIAFGQTNTVTAMQLITSFNAIANGGDLIQPHIVKEISHVDDATGNVVVDNPMDPKTKKGVLESDKTAILRGYLERTATQDGPPGSFLQGYNIGVKTGTAQKVDPNTGTYSADKYIASIIALAPVDNPQITIYLSVDEPGTGVYYGGQVATPLAKELFTKIFEYTESPLAKGAYGITKNIVVPDVRGKSIDEATKILKDNNLTLEVDGSGAIITSMDPIPGSTINAGGKVIAKAKGNTAETTIMVPDLVGKTPEFAKSLLEELGFSVGVEGDGDVDTQSIPNGTIVSKGTSITLTLKKESQY